MIPDHTHSLDPLVFERQYSADVKVITGYQPDVTTLGIKRTVTLIKRLKLGKGLKLVLIVNELLFQLLQDGHPLLLLDKGHEVERLSQVEWRRHLQRNSIRCSQSVCKH